MIKRWKTIAWIASIFPWILVFGLINTAVAQSQKKNKTVREMQVLSKAFVQNGMIPSRYTCDGSNISPDIEWSGFSDETRSFALICDDPDAPSGTFVHWVLYNIPKEINHLQEHFLVKGNLVKEITSGLNSAREPEYMGPCPPGGTHRYFFKIYALDGILNLKAGLSAADLMKEMEGHILAKGDLMGKYSRK
jgi:Raf kinase inhibitor-like YbhB/YbcL family protein